MIKSRDYGVGYLDAHRTYVRAIFTYENGEQKYFDRILNISYETWKECFAVWNSGKHISQAFPMLTSDEHNHLLDGNQSNRELQKAYPNMVIGRGGDA